MLLEQKQRDRARKGGRALACD